MSTRIMLWAVVATVISAAVLIVALTLWFVVLILPIILLAAAATYIAFRYQFWRATRSFSTRRDPLRRGPGGW